MRHFEKEMSSNTGWIMIEGGNKRWSELADAESCEAKSVFQLGCFAGLGRSAEDSDVLECVDDYFKPTAPANGAAPRG